MTISKLRELQAKYNEGRGITCVKDIINCLEQNKYSLAYTICCNENDKISNYPDVKLALFDLVPDYEEMLIQMHRAFGWSDPREALKEII